MDYLLFHIFLLRLAKMLAMALTDGTTCSEGFSMNTFDVALKVIIEGAF